MFRVFVDSRAAIYLFRLACVRVCFLLPPGEHYFGERGSVSRRMTLQGATSLVITPTRQRCERSHTFSQQQQRLYLRYLSFNHIHTPANMFRQIVSRAILPSLEKDLSKTLSKEVAAMDGMLGPMLPSQVFGYQQHAMRGAFSGSAPRSAPRVERVNYPAPAKGLFAN